MVHTLRFLAATGIQDNSHLVYVKPSSEGINNPGLLSRLMYFSLDRKVPKGQGYTRFARKRTSMIGFPGSIVRFIVVTDCFSDPALMVYSFVEGHFFIH